MLLGPVWADDFDTGAAAYGRKDYAEAVKWYRLSAAQGNANAQLNLGVIYSDGAGVKKDEAEAVKWYRLSAAKGQPIAQSILGLAYINGSGVKTDYVRAHMWLNLGKASGVGNTDHTNALLEKRMTNQQIGQAQKMARECHERNFKGCD